jgi:hypothetical protein
MPIVSGAHFQLPLRRSFAVMARNFQNEAIIGTEAACHLECIDQFRRTRHTQGDGLVARLRDIDPETKTGGPMAREFYEAVGPQSAAENEARLL